MRACVRVCVCPILYFVIPTPLTVSLTEKGWGMAKCRIEPAPVAIFRCKICDVLYTFAQNRLTYSREPPN